MCCNDHPSDTSSDIGVCASCLREKLFPILAAQFDVHSPPSISPGSVSPPRDTKSNGPELVRPDTHPPPLILPRSVSPPRDTKSNGQNRLFHGTRELASVKNPIKIEKIGSKPDTDCATPSSLPQQWFSGLFSGGDKKQPRMQPLDELKIWKKVPGRGRGMSPARVSDCGGGQSSGYLPEKPRRAVNPVSRFAGLGLCLRPLVQARPKRGWKSKSMPSEVAVAVVKPRLATAASFHPSRSRKIADFGRFNRRH